MLKHRNGFFDLIPFRSSNCFDSVNNDLIIFSKVISISDYLKQREEPKIKKIDLAQGDFEKTVSGLTSTDKDLIKEQLRKSGRRVSD